jgi:glycosyltransferase involved in cell wall biosynthesis
VTCAAPGLGRHDKMSRTSQERFRTTPTSMTDEIFDFLVIVPTYRRPEFLTEALKSVLRQTGVTKRIVVVDDCPEGSARPAIAGLDPSLIYLKNPQPSGGWPAKVRNYGFNISIALGIKARFVHFLDDDDTVPYGHYERVKNAFAAHSDVGVVFGVLRPFCVLSENLERRRRQEAQLRRMQQGYLRTVLRAWIYHHIGATLKLGAIRRWLYRSHAIFGDYLFLCSGAAIRHEQVVRLGGFNPEFRITEDYEFFTRAIIAGGAHFLERISANYRLGSLDSLWHPLELDAQAQVAHCAEVQRLLTLRYLRLQSEFGVFRFRLQRIAFTLVGQILDSVVVPLIGRLGVAGFRSTNIRRTA